MSAEAEGAAESPKKSKLGLIVGIVVGVLFLVGGTVVGIVLGPRLLGGGEAKADTSEEGEHEGEAAHGAEGDLESIVTFQFEPLIIDLRSDRGTVHHLKVGLSAELGDHITDKQFRLVMPRGRESAIQYLRALTYEEVSDPQKYASIQGELTKRVQEAVGKGRARRILLVDFVTQ